MKRLLLLVMKMLFDVIQLIDRLTQELKNYLRLLLFEEMREKKTKKTRTKKENTLRKTKSKRNENENNKKT